MPLTLWEVAAEFWSTWVEVISPAPAQVPVVEGAVQVYTSMRKLSMGEPPSLTGGAQVTVAWLGTLLNVPLTLVGAAGLPARVSSFDGSDHSPRPTALRARTR